MKFSSFNIILLSTALAFTACTKNFESLNSDPTKPTDAPPENILTGAEKAASDVMYSNYTNGKIGMLYAQFWSQTQKESDSQYQLDEGCNNTMWGIYSSALSNLDVIRQMNIANPQAVTSNQVAIAGILSVWIYQVLTDVYGNVPYKQALSGAANFTPVYDDASAIYDSLLQRLTTLTALFDSTKGNYKSGELIYNGNINQWKKLAGSLKLRLGIRMADASPQKSRAAVEAAFASGLITVNTDNALFPYLTGVPDQFPFNEQSGTGTPNDYVMSQTAVNFMAQLNDPRLPVYARPSTGDGTIKGKPYGQGVFSNDFTAYSYPGTKVYSPNFPGIIMTAAEVEFALAEAVERGYTIPGTAEQHYKNGIAASMKFWNVADSSAATYLTTVPYNTNKWKDCIGTQKWLALYMQGLQAWFERVRLNFKNPGDGAEIFMNPISLDPNVQIVPTRLTYPISEGNINHINYQNAGNAIGGDKKSTKLWWNKN
ncbi:SusD/RagB family nutrient-binding outer membrane lipoprotein [Chitinophagaceae bacterium LWZ2-11]